MTGLSMKRCVLGMMGCLALSGTVLAADERSLLEVTKAGDHEAALRLIASGADVNAAQPDGTTALHWAAYNDDDGLAQALLAKGAKAQVRNQFGVTPLTEAVKVADVVLVRRLIKAGARADAANDDGETLLMLAARTGVVDVAKELVQHGAKVNAKEQWRGQTALMGAAAEARGEMTAYLIRRGADVETRAFVNDWATQITNEPRAQYRPTAGLTALLFASRAGCEACVLALLKGHADINRPTPDGVTPLMTALDNFHFDLARVLLTHGANAQLADWWGRTALYVATDMNSYSGAGRNPQEKATALDLMQQLLASGVDPNTQLIMHRPGRGANSGRFTDDLLTVGATPLLRAAISCDTDAIRLLLAHGAQVDLPNAMGVTPLMAAAGMGISIRDPRGNLSGDVQGKAIAAVEVLLKGGADINARVTDTSGHTARIARPSTLTNRQGQTALFGAINWGWPKVVQYLLAHGARVDITDAAGKTPLDAIAGGAGGRDHKNVDEVASLIRAANKGGA
jgi:ankyrin repeat protein